MVALRSSVKMVGMACNVLSVKETNQRIYPLGMDFEIFKNHALQAAEQWQKRRQWFDSKWIASAL